MFRPGNIGHLGRLGLVAASQPSLVAQALAILAKYGSAANLYLPGVGAINGITAGNWLDSIGTTAATVDNQVGLVVSAGKYLGPELVANGTFENETNGWISDNSAVISSVGGNLRVTHGGTSNPYARQSISTVIGRTYSYSVTVRTTSSSAPTSIRAGTAKGGGQNFTSSSLTGARTVTAYFVATSSSTVISLLYLTSTPGDFADFDDVSVKEMPGAHLTQSTAANRPVLRRGLVNQLTQSDFQNGVTDAPTRGGLVTASTLAGYGGAIAFGHDGSATSYGYKLFAATLNAAYTLAFVVKMDDGNAPVFGNVNSQDASNPFAVVMYGNAYSPIGAGGYTVTALADNTYLVTCSAVATAAVATNFGVVKYPANNNRTFKVTRYGLFTGTVTASQILAAGGIPVTTTAPASSTSGAFAWQFDGTNDSFASTVLTGNEGWVCAGVTFGGAAAANETVFGSGAINDTDRGVWMLRSGGLGENHLRISVGNGAARATVLYTGAALRNTPRVVEGGWDALNAYVGVNGAITSAARTGTAGPSPTTGVIGNSSVFAHPLNGTIGATIIMPTVLPTATERATLRQFIASLSGVTM